MEIKTISLTEVAFLDIESKQIVSQENSVQLTGRESDVLIFLLSSNGVTRSRDDILDAIGKYDVFDHNIDKAVSNLRKKFKQIGISNDFIKTKNGFGYLINRSAPPKHLIKITDDSFLNTGAQQLERDGETRGLPKAEFFPLKALLLQPNVVKTHEQLARTFRDHASKTDYSRIVSTPMKRIRGKFNDLGIPKHVIRAEYGVGYVFVPLISQSSHSRHEEGEGGPSSRSLLWNPR